MVGASEEIEFNGRTFRITDDSPGWTIPEGINLPSKVPCLLKWLNNPWVCTVVKAEDVNSKVKMHLDTFSFADRGEDQLIEEGDKVSFINDIIQALAKFQKHRNCHSELISEFP